MMTSEEKYQKLCNILRGYESAVIAFSGGVDSTLLAFAAHEALEDHMIAVTASAPVVTQREQSSADSFCQSAHIPHAVLQYDIFSVPGFAQNPPDRCYLCKRALFTRFKEYARENGFSQVCEGSNMDDMQDYRPGMRAIRELGIRSPLQEAGLTKAEIRKLLHSRNIPVWNHPSAACLASRFVYGETITPQALSMVEQAENLLQDLQFTQKRVRVHGSLARIEILPEDFDRIMDPDTRCRIVQKLRELGFTYITLDLAGFRSGSMNEVLSQKDR